MYVSEPSIIAPCHFMPLWIPPGNETHRFHIMYASAMAPDRLIPAWQCTSTRPLGCPRFQLSSSPTPASMKARASGQKIITLKSKASRAGRALKAMPSSA